MELYGLTVHEAVDLLEKGEVSSEELTGAVLERIGAVDGRVKSYITLLPEEAMRQARLADEARARGEGAARPLLGVPIAIKDSICTRGIRTTCASRILDNYVPPFDATVIQRLLDAGAVVLGKLNLDEFTMGSTTEFSAYFTTRNPWNLERVPGGSSGGSGAAVAAGEALAALGSDTGGSIRTPAAFCGVVGVKPTYGRVSRYGLISHGSSLDQIGPITRDVEDSALLLRIMAGHDYMDSTTLDAPVPDYVAAIKETDGLKGLRVGVPGEYFGEGVDPGVEKAVLDAIGCMADMGAETVEISIPHTKYCLAIYYLVATSEASSNLARYDGVRYGLRVDGGDMWNTYRETRGAGFGPEVKRRIMLGTYALSAGYYDAYYLKAQRVRNLLRRDFERAFEKVDVIATPASPLIAFKIGEKIDDPLQMYKSDTHTISLNLAGVCGLSVPCGFVEGLPVGLQLMGPALGEEVILRAAHAYEQANEWHRMRPPL